MKGRKPTILVVDDNEAVRRVLVLALAGSGFEVKQADDGKAAVEMFRRGGIDVLLLDVLMPGHDGVQTLSAVRQIDPHIPAVFLSGDTGRYKIDELLAAGAAHVIQKPPDLGKLTKLLRSLVRESPSNRRVAERHHPTLGTVCRLDARGGPSPHLGLVWNLSRSGVSILLHEPLPAATPLRGELKTADHRGSLPITLQIVYIHPICTGDYYLGAQFETPLAPDQLDPFLAAAVPGT